METSTQWSARFAREQREKNEAIGRPNNPYPQMQTTPDIFSAHVESIVSIIREWQSGAMSWRVAAFRADVSAAGQEILREVTKGCSEREVRSIARRAVAA